MYQWLTPVILAAQEDLGLKSVLDKYLERPYLEKYPTRKGLTEWLKW
jgi:hypothetical protein